VVFFSLPVLDRASSFFRSLIEEDDTQKQIHHTFTSIIAIEKDEVSPISLLSHLLAERNKSFPMSVSTNTSEHNLAASRKLEKQIRSSAQPEEDYKPPDPLETAASSGASHATENQLRNQAKDLLHSSKPSKKQRRVSIKEGGVSYSSVLSLKPSRMSLRTLITPQVRRLCCFSCVRVVQKSCFRADRDKDTKLTLV
jgi:hypothetical protein